MTNSKKETRHGKHRSDKRNTTFRLTEAERNLAYEVARLEGYDNLAEMFRGLIKEKMDSLQKSKRQGGRTTQGLAKTAADAKRKS